MQEALAAARCALQYAATCYNMLRNIAAHYMTQHA